MCTFLMYLHKILYCLLFFPSTQTVGRQTSLEMVDTTVAQVGKNLGDAMRILGDGQR